jgi:putative flippase GtrA
MHLPPWLGRFLAPSAKTLRNLSQHRRFLDTGARFLLVGGLSTLIELGVFNLLVFGLGWDPVAGKIGASLVALANAYVGNREFTFRHRDRRGRRQELVLFLAANVVCTALGAAMVWAGVAIAQAVTHAEPGALLVNGINLFSIAVVVLARFALYHLVVFRAPGPGTRAPGSPTAAGDDGAAPDPAG